MSTDLKFSLITTLIVLGVIVAGGLTVSSALISSLLRWASPLFYPSLKRRRRTFCVLRLMRRDFSQQIPS